MIVVKNYIFNFDSFSFIFIINYIFIVLNYFYNLTYSFIEFEESSFKIVVLYYIIVFTYMIYNELTIIKEQKNGIQGYS